MDILHSLHGPGFALVALLILGYLNSQSRSNFRYVLAAGLAIGIGVIAEIAQIPGDRGAEISDLFTDALGIFGALGISASLDKNIRSMLASWARLALPAMAGAAIAAVCLPSLGLALALTQQKAGFPTLLSFESRWEMAAVTPINGQRPARVSAPLDWPGDGPTVAHAVETGQRRLFLSFHPLPDWRGYEKLSFLAGSTGDEFAMRVCIRDWEPGMRRGRLQYCTRVPLGPQAREYSISFSEIQAGSEAPPFDFSRVHTLAFGSTNRGANREILIDDIRLEK